MACHSCPLKPFNLHTLLPLPGKGLRDRCTLANKGHFATRAGVGHCWDVCRSVLALSTCPKMPTVHAQLLQTFQGNANSRGLPTNSKVLRFSLNRPPQAGYTFPMGVASACELLDGGIGPSTHLLVAVVLCLGLSALICTKNIPMVCKKYFTSFRRAIF